MRKETTAKRRFTTLFLDMDNVNIIKHVGMIPYSFQTDLDYLSEIVTYKNELMPFADVYTPGLKITYIKRRLGKTIDSALWLIKNARRIDVLYMYHITKETLFSLLIYKIMNPRALSVLDPEWNDHWYKNSFQKRKDGNLLQHFSFLCEKVILKQCCTLITQQLEGLQKLTMLHYGFSKEKVKCVPLGYYKMPEDQFVPLHKEHLLLTVGRLGTYQKNTELLVSAFINTLDKHDWKLVLIGNTESDFLDFFQKLVLANPLITERIVLTGAITERNLLDQWYQRAACFVLPSRFESFGIVLLEALRRGCYLLCSDSVDTMKEILQNHTWGNNFKNEDVKSLEEAIVDITNELDSIELPYQEMYSYVDENYNYNTIAKKIDGYLQTCHNYGSIS